MPALQLASLLNYSHLVFKKLVTLAQLDGRSISGLTKPTLKQNNYEIEQSNKSI